jgi:hypothetical protein
LLRSKVSNGTGLFVENVDGRSKESRRFRDVLAEIISDLGGADMVSDTRKLAGSADGDRQMVKILAAALDDGLAAVEAACAEANAQNVRSADVVLNILARRRDPGPPLTIVAPDALKLRHAPVADCARYDQLRRLG